MLGRVVIGAVLFLQGVGFAQGAGPSDLLGVREVSLGEAFRANATGAMATTLNPAGIALNREMAFEGAYAYRESDGASFMNLSACDSTGAMPGCYYYRYLTASPSIGSMSMSRKGHEGGMTLARAIHPNIVFGSTVKYFKYTTDLMTEENSSGVAFDVGLIGKFSILQVAFVGYNLAGNDQQQYARGLGTGVVLRPANALTLGADGSWNLDRDESGKGRFGAGVEYFVNLQNGQAGVPLRFGAVHDQLGSTNFLTGGVGFQTFKVGLDVGFRREMGGAKATTILAGLRLFGPRMTENQWSGSSYR